MSSDERTVAVLRQFATDLLGDKHIRPWEMGLGAEDFAVLSQQASGVRFRPGYRIEGDERKRHNLTSDLDGGCLPTGVAILAQAALRLLRE